MDTALTIVTATEATCPTCTWTTLNRWSVGAVGAAAAHTKAQHLDLWQQHFYFPQDGWDHVAAAWKPRKVTAVIVDAAGQLALFDGYISQPGQ